MAAKKLPVVHVAVVGLTSSSFPGMTGQGAGKSVLCNRFVRPKRDDLCLNHSSIMTNSDFGSSVVNNDHFLYWGEKVAALEDGSVSFQVSPHTHSKHMTDTHGERESGREGDRETHSPPQPNILL